MPHWLAFVLAACAVAVTVAVVVTILSARHAVQQAAAVIAVVERELSPLATEARGLTADARALTQETTRDLRRAGDVIEQVQEAASGVSRIVNALAGLTRAGQLIGLAAAVRRGAGVFVAHMRRQGGNHHGQ